MDSASFTNLFQLRDKLDGAAVVGAFCADAAAVALGDAAGDGEPDAEAAARGIKTIVGYYYPTAKNAMVREFYAQFGFAKTAEDADGNTTWTLDVAAYAPKHPHMKIER